MNRGQYDADAPENSTAAKWYKTSGEENAQESVNYQCQIYLGAVGKK